MGSFEGILTNEPRDVLKHTNFYTLGTLTRMSYKKEEEKWTRKLGSNPHPSPIPPTAPRTSASPPPSTSISPPQRVSTAPFSDPQTPLPESELSTPPLRSSAIITFEHMKELVSSLSDTFTSQL